MNETATNTIAERKRELTTRWREVCQRLDLHSSTSDRAAAIAELHEVEAAALRLILAEQREAPLDGEPRPAWHRGEGAA